MNDTATPVILEEYLRMHPADLADELQRLPHEQAANILLELPSARAAETLSELEEETQVELLHDMPPDKIATLANRLAPVDGADILGQISIGKQREVLGLVPEEHAEDIRNLLKYSEDTAGGIMSDRFIALQVDQTVQQCMEMLRNQVDRESSRENVSYLYVTDKADKLLGVVPIRDLVFANPERRIRDLMKRDLTFLKVDDDQEEIARKFEHYHFLGLPVLDRKGRLVGLIKASDALEIATEEATEDMQLMVGLSGEERALTPWTKSITQRLPWLYVNLATAFLAAIVVGFFEGTIAQWTALALFLPIVAGQGGNAGMQTLTVIIRDMALGELSPGDGRRAFIKEVILATVNGLAIGIVVGLIGWLWKGDITLGVVAGIAMLLNQVAAAMSGVLIPFSMKWLKIDPAMASSIFLTTVTDVAGFFFFLGLAALAIKFAM